MKEQSRRIIKAFLEGFTDIPKKIGEGISEIAENSVDTIYPEKKTRKGKEITKQDPTLPSDSPKQ